MPPTPRRRKGTLISMLWALAILAPASFAGEDEETCEPALFAEGSCEDGLGEWEPDCPLLYDQTSHCSSYGWLSQYFPGLGDPFDVDVESADDFEVPYDKVWQIECVRVAGFYKDIFGRDGGGPADWVNVRIYSDYRNLPGYLIYEGLELDPFEGLNSGDFFVELPDPPALGQGKYWISVQARMRFFFKGTWYWNTRYAEVVCNNRVTRNPDDFFHTGCTDFDYTYNCGDAHGRDKPDFCFALYGREACADLEVTKTASDDRVVLGRDLTFFVKVTNHGPLDAEDVVLTDILPRQFRVQQVKAPPGWSFNIVSDDVTATIPLLPSGECATFEIEVRATEVRERVTNVASVRSSTFECDAENNQDDETVRIFELTDGSIPALSDAGLALLALLLGATIVFFVRRS